MNAAVHAEEIVTEPLPQKAVGGGLEPIRRQRHDENSCGTDCTSDYDHSIGRKFLCKRTDDRHQDDDDNGVNRGNLADRRIQTELATAELRKYIIHLQKNGFEESDKEKKNEQPIEARLADEPSEEIDSVDCALADGRSEPAPKSWGR